MKKRTLIIFIASLVLTAALLKVSILNLGAQAASPLLSVEYSHTAE